MAVDMRSDDHCGRPFLLYKLRTMRRDAESKTGAVWAKIHDERVTLIGRFLRKTRIDEIPQFLNVLKGDMSIVGPRPERPVFVKQLRQCIESYDQRFAVKPGITGLAQVTYHYASSIEDAREKLKYDLMYAQHNTLFMDMKIFLSTVPTVIFARGSR
jgi:lipopolysaccharide/colanic/teichoic acid biosynthesis glycosyltransferase